jgi:hypothetical protein
LGLFFWQLKGFRLFLLPLEKGVRQELRIKKRGIKRFLDEFSGGSSAR